MNTLIIIAIFLVAGLLLNRVIDLTFRFIAKKRNSSHLHFFKSMANSVVIIIVVYSLAQQFSVTKDLSTTILQSGSLIVAIATFAAQQALGNVISGLSISMSKPYKVDEKIRVMQGGTVIAEGIVKDVMIRHTVINQFNGESCIVPNSVMDSSVIINTNYTANVGNFVEIEIAYDADIEEAIRIMRKVCSEHELTLNTEKNAVTVSGYTQNGIIVKTTIWTENLDDSFRACSDIRIALIKEFRESGIEIPYQTVTVHNPVRESGAVRQ